MLIFLGECRDPMADPIARIVDICDSDTSGHVVGAAIFYGGVVVGFSAMKRRSRNPDWATSNAAVVSGFRIDSRWQGLGLGSLALRHLPEWISNCWPETERIMLSVDEENGGAIRSYVKAGWHETGSRVQGRIGWVRYMTLELKRASRAA